MFQYFTHFLQFTRIFTATIRPHPSFFQPPRVVDFSAKPLQLILPISANLDYINISSNLWSPNWSRYYVKLGKQNYYNIIMARTNLLNVKNIFKQLNVGSVPNETMGPHCTFIVPICLQAFSNLSTSTQRAFLPNNSVPNEIMLLAERLCKQILRQLQYMVAFRSSCARF